MKKKIKWYIYANIYIDLVKENTKKCKKKLL